MITTRGILASRRAAGCTGRALLVCCAIPGLLAAAGCSSGSSAPRTSPSPRALEMRPVLAERGVTISSAPTARVSAIPSGTGATLSGTAVATPGVAPTDASDLAWITPDVMAQFRALDCSHRQPVADVLDRPLVTCSKSGDHVYVLGPVEVTATDITGARATQEANARGVTSGPWLVDVKLSKPGARRLAAATARTAALGLPRNELAMVVNSVVISAPQVMEAITGGEAQIMGEFSEDEARHLAAGFSG